MVSSVLAVYWRSMLASYMGVRWVDVGIDPEASLGDVDTLAGAIDVVVRWRLESGRNLWSTTLHRNERWLEPQQVLMRSLFIGVEGEVPCFDSLTAWLMLQGTTTSLWWISGVVCMMEPVRMLGRSRR